MCELCKKYGPFEKMMGTKSGDSIAVCKEGEDIAVCIFPQDGGHLLSILSKKEAEILADLLTPEK